MRAGDMRDTRWDPSLLPLPHPMGISSGEPLGQGPYAQAVYRGLSQGFAGLYPRAQAHTR